MQSRLLLFLLVFLFIACKQQEPKGTEVSCSKDSGKKTFTMYEMSEMAGLMEQMFVENKRLRNRIIEGDTLGSFPKYFLKIHSGVMTDPSENDLFFREHANQFIEAQQLIYKDSSNAKKNYNLAIDACIRCHETKCGGPIAKIKKLYLK